jgi:hypothetical protein
MRRAQLVLTITKAVRVLERRREQTQGGQCDPRFANKCIASIRTGPDDPSELRYTFCENSIPIQHYYLTDNVGRFDPNPTSDIMIPRIHAFVKKNERPASQRPGTKVLFPLNSSSNPCCNHKPWVATHRIAAARPRYFRANSEELGR